MTPEQTRTHTPATDDQSNTDGHESDDSDEPSVREGEDGRVEAILRDIDDLLPAERRALLRALGVADPDTDDGSRSADSTEVTPPRDESAEIERLWREYYQRHPDDPVAQRTMRHLSSVGPVTDPTPSPPSAPVSAPVRTSATDPALDERELAAYSREIGDLLGGGGGCAETWAALAEYRGE